MNPTSTLIAHIIPIIITTCVLAIIFVYIYFPKVKGLHYTSILTCPKCGHKFEYNWLPGGSFNAIRWGKYRFMRCPNCRQASWFDVWTTRVRK